MCRSRKAYTLAYKKRVDVERDTYLPRQSPKGLLWCTDCGAVYYRQHWTITPPQEIKERLESFNGVSFTLCPACRKIRDHYPSGELHLGGLWKVETTTEKLAQRLGRCLEKARGGKVVYKSHNNKFVRVLWQKEPLKKVA